MIHELKFLGDYVLIILRGLLRLYSAILQWCLRVLESMPLVERLFFLGTGCETLFTLQKWKSYEFITAEKPLVHGIYSDDFVYFLILNGLLFLGAFRYAPGLVRLSRLQLFWQILRFASLAGMSFFYLLNLFSPERIAPTPEAEFTFWFVLYGVVLAILWIIGILGITSMPRIREDEPLPSVRSHR